MSTDRKDESRPCSIEALRVVAGITLAEATYPGGAAVPDQVQESTLLLVVLEGAMTERRGARSVVCEAGTLAVLPRHEAYAHRFDAAGARIFVTQLGPDWVERMRPFGLPPLTAPVYVRSGRANALAGELYTELRTADEASRLAIDGYVLALSAELVRADARRERSARPPWLVRAAEQLHERVHGAAEGEADDAGGVRMEDIAADVGVHPVHLARTFREHYGTTMGEYLRRLRVERARTQLAATAKPLSQVAVEAGFADQAHFTRVFRTLVGTTPGAYRRAAAPAGSWGQLAAG
jgi:AraC family transcriptional regulator